jgi:hypothetical protein
MNLLQTEPLSGDPEHSSPARRRRARRLLAPLDADERAVVLDEVAHRASPSFDFFLFSLISGLVFSAGLLLDSPALLLLGAVFAPLMAPAVGVSLGAVIGSAGHFIRSLFGLLIGAGLVFLSGLGAGSLALYWLPSSLSQARFHAQLSWSNFLVLALGAILTAAAMTHDARRPVAPSVALAYQLYLPVAIAGLGLGSGQPHLFPDGLVIFALNLAWASLLGALTLAIMGFRPLSFFGYTLGGVLTLSGVILLIGLTGAGVVVSSQVALPTPIPSATPTLTLTPTSTATQPPPTATLTLTLTPTLAPTLTHTPTLSPTPVYAQIDTRDDKGAVLRAEPGGTILRSYFDGTLLQVLPELQEVDGVTWVKVIAPDGTQGWIVQDLLTGAVPPPNW